MPSAAKNGAWSRLQNTRIAIALALLATSGASGQEINASNNTVSGFIRLFDRNGDELADRSNIVVFIDGLPGSPPYQVPPNPPQVSHKDRQFSPRVMPLVRGTTVDFINDDDIYHNVFSLSQPKSFDLGIYAEGTSKLVTFPESGLVKLHCNIHPGMTSTILVLNNNLFAKTLPNGSYQIDGIPDGRVTLRVWSEFGEEQSRNISLSGGRESEESFDIHVTKRFVQHKNKFGKRYREKY